MVQQWKFNMSPMWAWLQVGLVLTVATVVGLAVAWALTLRLQRKVARLEGEPSDESPPQPVVSVISGWQYSLMAAVVLLLALLIYLTGISLGVLLWMPASVVLMWLWPKLQRAHQSWQVWRWRRRSRWRQIAIPKGGRLLDVELENVACLWHLSPADQRILEETKTLMSVDD
jgi:hypothetical protein